MQLRRSLTIAREAPVNAFDVAQMTGLDVRFLDVPSLEGMFVRDPGLRVFLPSFRHRPRSRILFSCAHEVGHYQFDHGTTADEYLADGQNHKASDEEFLANCFAAQLLMPRAAVMEAFHRRKWSTTSVTPLQVYLISGELGVGYETLLRHMAQSLEILSQDEQERLLRTTPKAIKLKLVGRESTGRIVYVDHFWSHVPIDAECGDLVLLPKDANIDCSLLRRTARHGTSAIYTAIRSGQELTTINGGEVPVRIARKNYTGPYANRYLKDPDEH